MRLLQGTRLENHTNKFTLLQGLGKTMAHLAKPEDSLHIIMGMTLGVYTLYAPPTFAVSVILLDTFGFKFSELWIK